MRLTSVQTRKIRTAAIALVAVVALYGLIGVFALPKLVRWGIEGRASEALGRAITVEDIRVNPYTLRIGLRGLTLHAGAAPGPAAPLATLRAAEVNVSAGSLWRLAPVVERLTLDGLRADIVRVGPQRFNFSDIVDRLLAGPKTDEPGADFALYNVQLTDGAIRFNDRVRNATNELTDIRIGIPFISSLPGHVNIDVEPLFQARLDGTPIELRGTTQPFNQTLESLVHLKLDGLDIPTYLSFSPVPLNFSVPRGTLAADLRITFRLAAPARGNLPAQPRALVIDGSVAVADFALDAPAAAPQPLVNWQRLAVDIAAVEPLDARYRLRTIALDAPAASVRRSDDGRLNWVDFAERPVLADSAPAEQASSAEGKPTPQSTPTAQPLAFDVENVTVRDGKIAFVDETAGQFALDVEALNVDAQRLSTTAADPGTVRLTGRSTIGESLSADGTLKLAPLSGRLAVQADGTRLRAASRYLAGILDAEIDGRTSMQGRLEFDRGDDGMRIALRDVSAEGKDLRIEGPRGSGAALRMPAVSLTGGLFDITGRAIAIDRLRIDAPRARFARLADGSIGWQQVFAATTAGADEGGAATAGAAAADEPAWTVRVREAAVRDGQVRFDDATTAPPFGIDIEAIQLTAKDITGEGQEPVRIALRARAAGGSIGARGTLAWNPLDVKLALDVRELEAVRAQPYLTGLLNAAIAEGELTTRGDVSLSQPEGNATPRIGYDGNLRVTNARAVATVNGEDLLRWQVFEIDRATVRVGDAPPRIDLGALALRDFYARVIVSPQGRLNLLDLVAEEPGTQAPSAPAAEADRSGTPPVIRIERIDFERGNVNFTDNFIRPNYTANLTGIDGSVTALASDAAAPATLSLTGKVDDEAPLTIGGRLNPLAPRAFLDIEGSTKGVDLPRLTPYSSKYAGYPITRGKLSMDVTYRLENGKLDASNHLFIDQLTLGEKVDSPDATDLPVPLAVALLKNARGEIDLTIPVSGSLDDPEFSLGGAIVQVLANLIAKIVTAPFAVLSAAFGGGEELGYVEFAAGSAQLAPGQTKRLDALAQALNERPALRLDVIGRVDPAADTEGVRQAKYESKLRAMKVKRSVRAGGVSVDPATVQISEAERPELIAAVYEDEDIPDKPRNFLGIARSIPVPDMERLILAGISAAPEDLRGLAGRRAAAVRDYLEQKGKVPRERLFLVEPKLTTEGITDKGATTRVDFALR